MQNQIPTEKTKEETPINAPAVETPNETSDNAPNGYNSKTKELSTCFMLWFENSHANSSGILYQPFIVGLYGYAPTDMPKFYTEYMEETITSQIRNLFSISNP